MTKINGAVGTVIVVDDDQASYKGISRIGRLAGFSVMAANNYAGFIACVAEMSFINAPPFHVCCVVMDARLINVEAELSVPEPMLDIPRIYIGPPNAADNVVKIPANRVFRFVAKPFVLEDMRQNILGAFENHKTKLQGIWFDTERLARLSERECEVGDLVARGMLNREIAERLGISIKTVKVHRANVMNKLELDSIADLVRCFDRFQSLGGEICKI